MKYLLDTAVWMWSVGAPEKLGREGNQILANSSAEIYLSAASSWEIAIKAKIGKYVLPEPPTTYVPKRLGEQGILTLQISQAHSLKIYELPLHHRDPFDRMIISQALVEEMTVLTSDRDFEKYAVPIVWCG